MRFLLERDQVIFQNFKMTLRIVWSHTTNVCIRYNSRDGYRIKGTDYVYLYTVLFE